MPRSTYTTTQTKQTQRDRQGSTGNTWKPKEIVQYHNKEEVIGREKSEGRSMNKGIRNSLKRQEVSVV